MAFMLVAASVADFGLYHFTSSCHVRSPAPGSRCITRRTSVDGRPTVDVMRAVARAPFNFSACVKFSARAAMSPVSISLPTPRPHARVIRHGLLGKAPLPRLRP